MQSVFFIGAFSLSFYEKSYINNMQFNCFSPNGQQKNDIFFFYGKLV